MSSTPRARATPSRARGDASTSAWQRVSCLPAATSARLMCPRRNDPRAWVFPEPPRTPFVHPSSPTASVSRAYDVWFYCVGILYCQSSHPMSAGTLFRVTAGMAASDGSAML